MFEWKEAVVVAWCTLSTSFWNLTGKRRSVSLWPLVRVNGRGQQCSGFPSNTWGSIVEWMHDRWLQPGRPFSALFQHCLSNFSPEALEVGLQVVAGLWHDCFRQVTRPLAYPYPRCVTTFGGLLDLRQRVFGSNLHGVAVMAVESPPIHDWAVTDWLILSAVPHCYTLSNPVVSPKIPLMAFECRHDLATHPLAFMKLHVHDALLV